MERHGQTGNWGEEGKKEGRWWDLKLGRIRKDEGDILDFAPPPKAGGETRPAYAGVPGALLPVSPTLTYRIIQQIRIGPLGGNWWVIPKLPTAEFSTIIRIISHLWSLCCLALYSVLEDCSPKGM